MKILILSVISFILLVNIVSATSVGVICINNETNGQLIMTNSNISEENLTSLKLLFSSKYFEGCNIIENYSSCNCVEIEDRQFNSSEIIRIITYYKNMAENPEPDSCNFIINNLNGTIAQKNNKINMWRSIAILLIFLIVVYFLNKLRKRKK